MYILVRLEMTWSVNSLLYTPIKPKEHFSKVNKKDLSRILSKNVFPQFLTSF